MSHQIVLTFDLDENKIQENAEKEAGRQVAREVIDSAFGHSYDQKRLIEKYVYQAIKDILEPIKDEIIAAAVHEVVANLHKTKAVKEMLAEVANGRSERPENS